MATFIFDFDDTLFDNAKFKKDIFDVFKSFSVPEEIILNSYANSRDAYNFLRHIEEIKNIHETPLEEKLIFESLEKLDFNKYVFSGIHRVLEELSQNHKLILLSYGEESLQKKKINESGLAKHFHQIHITSGNKVDVLKKIELDDTVYFLNDKISENELVQKEFPHFKIFLISKENPISEVIRQI